MNSTNPLPQPIKGDQPAICVLANNIRSLYNVGALFRLCDGVGVTRLYLTGITGAPFDDLKHTRQRAQIAKTALEGLTTVDWEYHADPLTLIIDLQQQGVQTVALEQSAGSQPYRTASYRSPVCLILGHETNGVDRSILDIVDMAVEIPMFGQGKSLNVISSASVALYHLRQSLTS
jgi:tRNA G18 (ribose-2'-O)-methylase SpoU